MPCVQSFLINIDLYDKGYLKVHGEGLARALGVLSVSYILPTFLRLLEPVFFASVTVNLPRGLLSIHEFLFRSATHRLKHAGMLG